jgi:tRNA threonylcarbamoyladenosine biosynthesis protein TsaE
MKIGRVIAGNLRPGDILCLFGQLGSGKTVLVKGIASGLGVDKDKIISPTFVLIRQYAGKRLPLYHFDLYRLSSPGEISVLGYEEYFYAEGVTAIEWPERLKYLLPKECLKIKLSVRGERERSLEFKAAGKRYCELLEKINADLRD